MNRGATCARYRSLAFGVAGTTDPAGVRQRENVLGTFGRYGDITARIDIRIRRRANKIGGLNPSLSLFDNDLDVEPDANASAFEARRERARSAKQFGIVLGAYRDVVDGIDVGALADRCKRCLLYTSDAADD